MIKILVTGPESSGNRMLCRIFREAGANILHKPIPMSTHYVREGVWTDFSKEDWDYAVVIHRDWFCTINSQVEAKHVQDINEAIKRTRKAIINIYEQLSKFNKPWFTITYESLANPSAVFKLCEILGLNADCVKTVWYDANIKYYGGPSWSEHRPLWSYPESDGSLPMHRDDSNFPRLKSPLFP